MHRALEGVKVIAVEHAVAAPLCSRHLSEMGADVIKIERPEGGDFAREYDDYVLGEASHFSWLNHGKKSLTLDLKSEAGVTKLKELLADADVFLSNLAPGAFERIIDNDEMEKFEKLIRCHISGYGPDGPYANRKAYDLLIQGEIGVIASTGTEEQKARPGVSIADLAGGIYALSAINAALVERARTGKGQRIDISLFDALAEWMSPLLLAQKYTGKTPPPAGRGHASITPYGPYPTKDKKEVQIAVQNNGQWQRLCRDVLERNDLADDESLADNSGRLARREFVESETAKSFMNFDLDELIQRLSSSDVPYGVMREVEDVVEHPQLEKRGRWFTAKTQAGKDFQTLLPPFLNQPDEMTIRKVPALGEHSESFS